MHWADWATCQVHNTDYQVGKGGALKVEIKSLEKLG
jgi:hypothetical protein